MRHRHYTVLMQRENITGVVMNGRSAQAEGSRSDVERPWKKVIEREVKEQMRSVSLVLRVVHGTFGDMYVF